MTNVKRALALCLVAVLTLGILGAGCGGTKPQAKPEAKPATPAKTEQPASGKAVSLKASAGGVGGAWYTVLAGLAEIVKEKDPSISMQVVPGGGLINPPRVGSGDVEMAFVFPSLAKAVIEGKDPFDKAYPDVRAVAAGFGNAVAQFVVAEDTGITSIKEIVDKKYPLKIASDRVGTTDEWLLRTIFKYYGVTYDTIASWGGRVMQAGYGDQAVLFKDRHVDAIFGNIAVPWTAVMEGQLSRKMRILPLPDDLRKHLIENFACAEGEIPAGSYGFVKEKIPTVASLTMLACHKNVPEDVIYRITKILCENPDRVRATHDSAKVFDPKTAWKDTGAPLHPGAEKYYKEAGLMK